MLTRPPVARVICDSSYLADRKNLAAPSDVIVLAALGHAEKMEIVERLSEGPARQKALASELGFSSGTLSRWLTELTHARIVAQDKEGTHDAYWLVRPGRTNELLDLAAQLAYELADAYADRAQQQAAVDQRRLKERKSRRR